MGYIVLEEDQFKEIRMDIREIKDALIKQGKMTSPKKYLNTKGAAEYLNVSVRCIYHYCQKNLLNPKKAGGTLLFEIDEIEQLIKKN
jgi:hypothetical protein